MSISLIRNIGPLSIGNMRIPSFLPCSLHEHEHEYEPEHEPDMIRNI